MRQGQTVGRFKVRTRDGNRVEIVFRFPKKGDAKAALEMVNFIRREADYLGQRRMETLAFEKKWLDARLDDMRKRKGFVLLVEADGSLVGDLSVQCCKYDTSPHVGELGIMLKEQFTGLKIGTRLLKKALQIAKRETPFRIIESGYFAKNHRSKKLHKKFGFKKYGSMPNASKLRDGSYCDHVHVFKQIKPL
jgi:RimJ/RimL family protein N-acetyltransferase